MQHVKRKRCGREACPYYHNPEKREVKYVGDPTKTDILVIGESPGWNEEREGLPFVGASGRVLEAVLGSVGLHRGMVMVANAARCRLDKENDSTKIINTVVSECKNCIEILIEAMKPKLIITLGVIALRQLTGKQKILENRGKFFETDYGPLFATVHPAYVLRGCSKGFPTKPIHTMDLKEKIIFEDFKTALTWMKQGARKRKSLESPIEVGGYKEGKPVHLKEFKDAELLAIDFETTGLDMHDKNIRVLSVGFCSEKGVARVFLADKKGNLPKAVVRRMAAQQSKKLVANRSFEDSVCHRKLGMVLGGEVHDVQIMAHVYDERSPQYRLEFLADNFTTLKGIKTLSHGMIASMQDLPKDKLISYNGVDCDATLRIFLSLRKELRNDERLARYYMSFVQPVADMFSRTQQNGLPIDTEALKKAEKVVKGWMTKELNKAIRAIPPGVANAKIHKQRGLKLTRRELLIDALFKHPKGYRLKPIKRIITKKIMTKLMEKCGPSAVLIKYLVHVNHMLIFQKHTQTI